MLKEMIQGSMRVLMVLLAVSLVLPPVGASESDELDFQLREELEAVVGKQAKALYDIKNEDGLRYQRATFSKNFNKVDDNTYTVAFTKDIASKEEMTTERYELTLSKASGKWEITIEEQQDTYQTLIRETPGDEELYKFDSFAFDAEGLKVSVTNGTLAVDQLLGKPTSLVFGGSSLAYEYTPPDDLSYHQQSINETLKKEHSEDFVFNPQVAWIECDAETCQKFLDSVTGLVKIEKSALDSGLRKLFDESIKDQKEARKERAFSGFKLPLEPDRRRYSFGIKRTARDHWIYLVYDSYAPWDVTVGASGYGPLFGYLSDESRAAGIAPYDVELRDDMAASRYQLEGIVGTLELGLEDPELVKADLAFTIETKRAVREIPFRLNSVRGIDGAATSDRRASITVNSLEDGDGNELTWVRTSGSGGLVIFPDVLPAGTMATIRMGFQTKGSIVKITPSYQYMDRSGWLPFVRYGDKIHELDLTFKVRSKYKTLGQGTKVSESTKGGVTTTHWVASSAVGFPTVIFGDYYEDSPKTVATKLDGTVIPVTMHVDRVGMQDWEIRPKQLRPLAEQAVNALNLYRDLYGMDYPYGKLDLVNDPLGFLYGQAPASIIYLGSGAFRGEAELATTLRTRSSGSIAKFTGSLVAHEVAHQWWGSLVGTKNMRNYWFVESLAEYSSAVFIEVTEGVDKPEKGRKAYQDHVAMWRKEILETDLLSSVQDANSLWSNGGRTAALYSKGPYAFHMMRQTFGDDKFFEFLKTLGQELGGKEIVSRDIQMVAEKSFGGIDEQGNPYTVDLEWFFDQWIRGVGIPEYSFNYNYRQTEDGKYLVEGEVTQRVVAGIKKRELDGVYYRGIVPVTVTCKNKKEYQPKLLIQGETTPFAFKVPNEPIEVSLNKYGEILAHPILENKSW